MARNNRADSFSKPEQIPSIWTPDTGVKIDKTFDAVYRALRLINARAIEAAAGGSSGGGITGLSGDVVAGPGTGVQAATITNGAVSLAKLADLATKRVIGRNTAGTGTPEAVTASQILDWLNTATQGSIAYRDASDWNLLGPGTNGFFLKTQGAAANPIWATVAGTGGAFLNGTGHPQGVTSGAVGSYYIDTNTGNVFRKLGGSTTAYGWYFEKAGNPGYGPQRYAMGVLSDSDVGSFTATSGWSLGFAQPSTNNSWIAAAAAGTNTRLLLTDGFWNQFQAASTSGTVALVRTGQGIQGWVDQDFDLTFTIYLLTAVTTVRVFAGIFSTAPTNSDNNGGNGIGIRFSTNVPDAGWIGYTRNSTGPVVGTTSSLGSVAISTPYKLRIRFIRAGTPTAYFSVNDGTEASLTTGIPATGGTQALYLTICPLANVARPIAWKAVDLIFGSQV